MFKGKEDLLYDPRNMFIWFLLAFQGGCLNTGGYLAVHRFVSHVTGFATLAGVAGAKMEWSTMFGMITVPFFFLLGVMISAWNVERRRIQKKAPHYSFVFSIIFFNIFAVAVFGSLGYLGEFGEPLAGNRDYFVLFILAFTCGLQNAVITSASGALIRTTHLTGPITDFGIGLVRIWSTRKALHKPEVFAAWCRFGLYFSFMLGSLISAIFYTRFQFFGFYLPLAISLFTALRLRAFHIKNM